jgi:hypothetical protein
MRRVGFLVLAICAAASLRAAPQRNLQVDAAFPGGNIVVDSIAGDTITVHRDIRDTAADWFYYYFRVRGAAGHRITVNFTQRDPMVAAGPAVSTDGGGTWTWLGAGNVTRIGKDPPWTVINSESVVRSSFHYEVPKGAGEVRFCMAMPYMEANLKAFLKRHRGSANLRVATLCRTGKGRAAEALYLGRLDGKPDVRVLLTARHHSCEMMASHAVEGIMESILANTPEGKWFRDHVEFLVIPFVDKDGVEDGDQGKNRKPWDHNRDYAGESIHATVAALRSLTREWSGGKLRMALDMHDPFVRGKCHEVIYGVSGGAEAQRFAKTLEAAGRGPLLFRSDDYAPCRATGNGPDMQTYASPRKSFGGWARDLDGVKLATTIELPYAMATGRMVTMESAATFGRDVARAMCQYLQEVR